MTSREVSNILNGQVIVSVDLHSGGRSAGGAPLQDVEIYLEGGGRLTFQVQESAKGGYYDVSMAIANVPERGAVLFTARTGGKLSGRDTVSSHGEGEDRGRSGG